MKTITMYELLGMIKDGKEPKKVKYREMLYHICYEYGDYESDIEEYRFADTKEHYYLFEGIDMLKCLNDEVEILEEEPRDIEVCGSLFTKSEYDKLAHSEEEKKIPEKLSPLSASDILDIIGTKYTKAQDKALQNLFEHIRNQDKKINEIIDCLDYLKSKGDE